ncbi:MAG: FG-GAP-like repeat-containing protein, partial [Bacillota bacterium]
MSAFRRLRSLPAFSLSLFFALAASANAVDLSAATHLPIPGDFNGDGRLDALFQPLTAGGKGIIMLRDGMGRLTVMAQQWDPNYLGVDWSAKGSALTTADLNGDGQDDVFVQPRKAGSNAAVLITDPTGQLLKVTQIVPAGYLGLDWSAAGTLMVPGDFDGDRQKELLLQPAQPGALGAIVHADIAGNLVAVVQPIEDGYLNRRWNATDVTLYVGDFNGDGRQDLLMQVKSTASAAAESAYALLLAGPDGRFTQVNETWNAKDLGANWNPATHKILIQDVNHDGIMDIVVQSTVPGGSNYLFEGNSQGVFTQPTVKWTGNKSAAAALKTQQLTSPNHGISVTVTQPTSKVTVDPGSENPPIPKGGWGVQVQNASQIVAASGVGALQGQPGVSGGTATYTIPIVVPPGRHGMQPSVSLNYSSRGGNGEVGMGWSLSAGSQIHRCPATVAMDGYSTGVNYTSTDRLCLDGQHLIYWQGGSGYGTDGAEYRTELDSFALVKESGDIGSATSPASFTVKEKNGHILTYGGTAVFVSSDVQLPLAWGLATETDGANNSIIYNYSQFGAGEYLLSSIQYTGVGNTPGNR